MLLYNLTLQPPTQVTQAVLGNFSGEKAQELVLARGTRLDLVRPDLTTGKLVTLLSHDVFGVVRSIAPFRLTGASKDYLVVTSDSGRLIILEYMPPTNAFRRVQMETFGKSGVRRSVPGEYLAVDPRGRALLTAAVEKQKLAYILNRDATAALTISSPLEAHRAHTLVFSCVALDVGFENPVFACLEVDYGEADEDPTGEALENTDKVLTYYELDLGLNHIVRKWSEPVDPSANLLVPLPGGALTETTTEGPSGVLVCSEGYVTYRHQGVPELRVPIPRRSATDRAPLIVTGVVHKMKKTIFVLLQTDQGDLFKVSVDYEGERAQALRIKYFDTIPVAASLCVFRAGFLFAAAEFGNHTLYQFEQLGDDDDLPELSSADFNVDEEDLNDPRLAFTPRDLVNLAPVDELESLAPLLDANLHNLAQEDTPQIYALCGRGPTSTFKVLRHGLEAAEVAVSELPGHPRAIWSTQLTAADPYDSYIVVSFVDATLVLAIGETVEEVTDSGFLTTKPTLAVQQMGADLLLQVHPQGYRLIRADRRASEWRPPNHQEVVHAAANHRQLVLALTSGELIYFELDAATGQLEEHEETADLGDEVTALSLPAVPEGQLRARFVAAALVDSTVRVLGLDPARRLEPLAMQALTDVPSSLCMLDMADRETDPHLTTLYLYIGLRSGVMLRTVVDHQGGQLSETRTRFLGSKPVQLFSVVANGVPAVLALSSRPWLSYVYQGRTRLAPIAYDALNYACAFRSEACLEGLVAVAENTLRILTVERLGVPLNQAAVPLQHTPRRALLYPPSNHFVIYETDAQPAMAETDDAEGPAWSSCLRVLNPLTGETSWQESLTGGNAVFGMGLVHFASEGPDAPPLLVVGTARGAALQTGEFKAAHLRTYRFSTDGTQLSLVHTTPVDGIARAIADFQGRALVGLGATLRIYDLGKRKLLRKCQSQAIPRMVVDLKVRGQRIYVSDVQASVHFAMYRPQENRLAVFADDLLPRWMTAAELLDYDTVAGGDKFGNLFVVRLADDVSRRIDADASGNLLYHEKGYLQGAPHKLTTEAHFYLGDTVTSLRRATLVAGGRELLFYTTLGGTVGAAIPFASKDDAEFFQTLEMHLRAELPPLVGRDHLAYRGYYAPVRSVVDGDLCEQFALLPPAKRDQIAEELDRTAGEVGKKIEDLRSMFAF
ncbi:pre-mRNA-splicing factor rse1 [Tieghemiomyces parasiticus]|uniref:Pre-mRNA-splicing factor rse1 n=1 Tax=Tieghemiomyces parasiticus TaxID=78921 RepID=A0A9W8AJ99_9FUNG|nr:pre-mRNA-splicing factor rse1 [Tieghemiomyces parasiticus]